MSDKDDTAEDPFEDLLREVAATPPAPAPPLEMLEQQRYRILDLVGGGGGGQVYRAFDEQLGRNVALKFLNYAGPEQSAQLVAEARTQARIKHPSICQVFEVVESNGRPFIAMQLIDGPTLHDAAPRLNQTEKVSILRRVAEAVDAAHQQGIVHRDLKPGNIMLERATDGWHPYVMDFGLARDLDKTVSVGMAGTPHFMAPEQARGDVRAIGPATDVWALGATLFEVLLGRPPFDADSVLSILRMVETEEPTIPSSLPRDLSAIVSRCLEKAPQRRYASAGALALDLAAFERSEPVSARRGSWARSVRLAARRHSVAATLIGVVVVGAPLGWWLVKRQAVRNWRAQTVPIQPSYDETAGPLSVSPDGKQLLFSSSRGGETQLYLQPSEGGPARAILGTDAAVRPSWSSKGDAVYYMSQDDAGPHIKKMALPSGEASTVVDADELVECAGRIFIARRYGNRLERLFVLEAGGERELASSDRELRNLSCSSDGRRVAYNVGVTNERVAWIDVDERVEHVLPALGDNSLNPAFHPNGQTLLFQVRNHNESSTLWEQRLDGKAARQLTTGGHEWCPQPAFDGRLFFASGEVTRVFSARPLDGSPPHRVGASNPWWQALELLPDGKTLLTSRPTKHHQSEIVLIGLGDDNERVIGSGQMPRISPDGREIYSISNDWHSLWVMPTEGGLFRELAKAPAEIDNIFAGSDALHVMLAGKTSQAWRQPYDGSPGAAEGPSGVRMLLPAADGWTVAFGPRSEAIILPPGPVPATAPAATRFFHPRLTADRRSFVARDDHDAVWLVDIASGTEHKLAKVPHVVGAIVSADGKTLFTAENLRRTQRTILTNYKDLPPL
jgi:Tol biopolymer transport system component